MDDLPAADVNRLLAEFNELHDAWAHAHEEFDWTLLAELARRGAQAYNEGAGPSFQKVALDVREHDVFHERFLEDLLEAGFDPFKLVRTGVGSPLLTVLNHDGLAEAAKANACSQRMRRTLEALARCRFAPLLKAREAQPDQMQALELCAASVPPDLLREIAPALAEARRAPEGRMVTGIEEGRLSAGEMIAENLSRPYG